MTSLLRTPAVSRRATAISLAAMALAGALGWPGLARATEPDAASATTWAAASPDSVAVVTDRMIIKYRNGSAAALRPNFATMAAAHDTVNRAGVQMARLRGNAMSAHVMALDRAIGIEQARALATEIMRGDSNVEYAEPDLLLHKMLVPNDPSFGSQWHFSEATAGINAPTAWNRTTGTGVVVAVVDTGYRPHADLAANILPGYDMVSTAAVGNDGNGRDTSALDPGDANVANECGAGTGASSSSWHGTHVAGTIAALGNNGLGVAGVAYGAKLLPVRALGKCGGYTSDIADSVIWASGGLVTGAAANANPARVINLSLGGTGSCSSTMQAAITKARLNGAVVVVAAGNSAASATGATPANCHGVVAVASVGRSGARAYYSNTGSNVAVAAPGGDMRSGTANGILSTLNTGSTTPGADSYAYYQGTSMATPHVAGVAALMIAAKPTLTVEQVTELLRSSVRAFPVACSGCGTGIVDAGLAVTAAAAAPTATLTTVAEVEFNNTMATAQVISPTRALYNGTMANSVDVDLVKVSLAAGRTLTGLLTPNASANYNLALYNGSGQLLSSSSNSGLGAADSVIYTNHGTGAVTLMLRVARASGTMGTGAAGAYTLRITQ